jgi:hypothetical protein
MFEFHGNRVYGVRNDGNQVEIATAESESWAETIADALNADPDVYVA